MTKFYRGTLEEMLKRTVGRNEDWAVAFSHGTLELGLYAPRGEDMQSPHEQDEIYVVIQGQGTFVIDNERHEFGPGDTLFVAAGAVHRFENRAPDHVVIHCERSLPRLELEMTLLMWRNHFTCDVLAERGSAHIQSLCKWGPSLFIKRTRVLPSGRPPEETETLVQDDPTWALEYAHFKSLCRAGAQTDLSNDIWLNRVLLRLAETAAAEEPR